MATAKKPAQKLEPTNRKNLLHREPSVINQKLIRSSLRALLPKGEEGVYAREQGVNERTAEFLLIEFQTIARIANISHMVALKKLKLSNNVIDEISGLETLVNLTHLDLAYNCIKKIEGLDKLIKLQEINLHRNYISHLEGMDNQLRLEYFIISANGLNNTENLKYLRRLPRLRMLVVQGNPICTDPNLRQYILTILPEVLVLDYQRIPMAEKMAAIQDKNALKLAKLSTLDANARRASIAEAEVEEQKMYVKAFVEGFHEDQFWDALYLEDIQGQIILQIDEIEETRTTYKELFRRAAMELFNKGMKAFNLREDEYNAFNIAMKETKDVVKLKGQKLTEECTDFSRNMIREMRNIVVALDEIERNRTVNTSAADEHNSMALLEANKIQTIEKNAQEERLHKICLEFVRKLHVLWYTMMTEEVELNEQILEVGQDLARSVRDLVVGWLEQIRGHFAQLRDVQIQYNERLVESLITYGDFRVSDTSIPEHLKPILANKEGLAVIVQQSHEHHVAVIDQKEEALTVNLKNWLEQATNNIRIDEVGRSRRRICELSHFVDTHYAQLHKFKILAHIRGYVPELRADQNKIPKKHRKGEVEEEEKTYFEKKEEEKKQGLEKGSLAVQGARRYTKAKEPKKPRPGKSKAAAGQTSVAGAPPAAGAAAAKTPSKSGASTTTAAAAAKPKA